MAHKKFYSKILLLGEYSIISGGQAITVPFNRYHGYLNFLDWADEQYKKAAVESNSILKKFYTYFSASISEYRDGMIPDMDLMKNDIDNGMYFHSNIPQGYGVGSSGAMMAALLYQYTNKQIPDFDDDDKISDILKILAHMESFFHGNSSGLDPLSSFMGKAFHFKSPSQLSFLPSPLFIVNDKIVPFLIDTRQIGNTKPLVNWYKEEVAIGNFNEKYLRKLNDGLISSLITKDINSFQNILKQLSYFQLEKMKPMIPENMRFLWQSGLDQDTWITKLCGSGGGGFLLAFTNDYTSTKKNIEEAGFLIVPAII